MNVDMSGIGQAIGPKHPVHEGLEAIGLFDDDAGIFPQGRVGQFLFQELGSATQPAQGILDLVSQTADQGLSSLMLGKQVFLAVNA